MNIVLSTNIKITADLPIGKTFPKIDFQLNDNLIQVKTMK